MNKPAVIDETRDQIQGIVGSGDFAVIQPLLHRPLNSAHHRWRTGFFPLRYHVQYGAADRQTKLMIKPNLFIRLHNHPDKFLPKNTRPQ